MNEKKNKHLTLDDRTEIQDCLYKRMTFKAIAGLIEKTDHGFLHNYITTKRD